MISTINMNSVITIALIFLMCANLRAQLLFDSEPEVRVQIINTLEKLRVFFHGDWIIKGTDFEMEVTDESGLFKIHTDSQAIQIHYNDKTINTEVNHLDLYCQTQDGTIKIRDVPYGVGWWWEGKEDRIYEGVIRIFLGETGTFDVIVQLPLEAYLKGVVPYEMGNDSPLEALKAQAVAARSEAIIALTSGLYSGEHHDLTSDVECQVFSGNEKRTQNSDRAVEETKSLILSEKGQPINAYYASNCGGHSELIKNVWPDRPVPDTYKLAGRDSENRINLNLQSEKDARQWIFSKPEVYCNPDLGVELPDWSKKNFRWKRVTDVSTLSRNITGENTREDILNIRILKRGISGRIKSARFVFENDSILVEGELAIRQLWKPALRSSCFIIQMESDKIVLHGAGWGHGVGMCQSGAIALAKRGVSFRMILRHYYREADIIKIY
jgi:SpoIID/LytB domain protein